MRRAPSRLSGCAERHGKVDSKRLPHPGGGRHAGRRGAAPEANIHSEVTRELSSLIAEGLVERVEPMPTARAWAPTRARGANANRWSRLRVPPEIGEMFTSDRGGARRYYQRRLAARSTTEGARPGAGLARRQERGGSPPRCWLEPGRASRFTHERAGCAGPPPPPVGAARRGEERR